MRLTIKLHLAVAFTALAMISGAQGIVSISQVSQIKADIHDLSDVLIPMVVAVNEIDDAVSEIRIKQYRVLGLSNSSSDLASNLDQYHAAQNALAGAIDRYKVVAASAARTEALKEFTDDWRRYSEISDDIFRTFESDGQAAKALSKIGSHRLLFDKLRGELSAVVVSDSGSARQSARDAERAAITTGRIAWLCMVAAVGSALVAMLFSFLHISRPIDVVTHVMKVLAAGDFSRPVPFLGRKDEIGGMAGAVQVFRANLSKNLALEREAEVARADAAGQRKQIVHELAERFEQAISSIAVAAATNAAAMRSTASALADAASETATRSATVAIAAREAAASAASVADAAQDLGSSVQSVHEQVSGSAHLAKLAVGEATETEVLIEGLVGSASRIGAIVQVISTIANQTNLLALNAAIEAAAAGQRGSGFAVVALEVKNLAKQTSSATEDIGRQISSIQEATISAAAAIRRIGSRITEISDLSASMTRSSAQQKLVTLSMVQTIRDASDGSKQVTSNIGYVVHATEATGMASRHVRDTASDLAAQSRFLQTEVARFLDEVRAAA